MRKVTAMMLLSLTVLIATEAQGQASGPFPNQPFDCSETYRYQDVHRSPPGAGIESVNVKRYTGRVPHLRAASNRGNTANDWLDDELGWWELQDSHDGPYGIVNPSRFAAVPNNGTFLVRFYGEFSDEGTWKEFKIRKQCTPTQTQITYYNGRDAEPNVVITITWTKPYP